MEEIFGYLPVDGTRMAALVDQSAALAPDTARSVALRAPIVHRDGHLAIAFRGRATLGGKTQDPEDTVREFFACYSRKGPDALGSLRGSFSLAVLDLQAGSALLAVDRMGRETLSWAADEEGIAFGTSAWKVATAGNRSAEINNQALFDFMLDHMVAAPDTAYRDVWKLPPASYVEIVRGRAALRRYWSPDFERVPRSKLAGLRSEVLPTLKDAVEDVRPDEHTGAFLSGGLDSSTVTGILTRCRGREAKAFSVGFEAEDFDELAYARAAVRKFGCRHFEYKVTAGDIVEVLPRVAEAYDEPFGNSSAVPTFCCARFAKSHGVDHLLAGDGGDELFGGNERYKQQRVFEAYYVLPKFLRRHLAEPLARWLDPESSPFPLRKLSSYVRQANIPLPERFQSWNLVYREGADAIFEREFLTTVDMQHAFRKMREVWEACPAEDLLDRMLWFDWKYTLSDNDLRKVSRMCELAEVEVSYPMLDERIVDLSLRVPSKDKISRTRLRAFYKDAVRGFLPDEIIAKKKHGFGLPFGLWLKSHAPLQELVYDSLSALKQYRILNPDFIERVAKEHRDGHPSYYGYAIWDLVMLEHWLRRHTREA